MDAEIFFRFEVLTERFIKWAHRESNAAAVIDQCRCIGTQTVMDLINLPAVEINRRFSTFNDHIETAKRDECISEGPGDLRVDFTDHQGGLFDGRQRNICANAQAAKAGLVWRRDLDRGDINGDLTGFEYFGNLVIPTGNEIGKSLGNGFAGFPTAEERFLGDICSNAERLL